MTSSETHFSGKISQKAIILCDGDVLVCRGVGDTFWQFPGGRLHEGEDPVAGLQREVEEEFQLKVENARPFHVVKSFHFKDNIEQILLIYTATAPTPVFTLNDESEEAKWIPKAELATFPLFDDCASAVRMYLQQL